MKLKIRLCAVLLSEKNTKGLTYSRQIQALMYGLIQDLKVRGGWLVSCMKAQPTFETDSHTVTAMFKTDSHTVTGNVGSYPTFETDSHTATGNVGSYPQRIL